MMQEGRREKFSDERSALRAVKCPAGVARRERFCLSVVREFAGQLFGKPSSLVAVKKPVGTDQLVAKKSLAVDADSPVRSESIGIFQSNRVRAASRDSHGYRGGYAIELL
jgi:hypothetical protein